MTLSEQEKIVQMNMKNPNFNILSFITDKTVEVECRSCGCKRVYGEQHMRKNPAVCKKCKLKNNYNYDIDTKEQHCTDCGSYYEKPNSNHHKWFCHVCNRDNPEANALRLLSQAGYKVKKTFRYNSRRLLTGDLVVKKDNIKLFIEIDGNSH